MNKYLVGIPVLFGVDHTREAIESCIHEQSDVLIVDNNAPEPVKNVIKEFDGKVIVKVNNQNEFVNPAWNYILQYFLSYKEYTHVVLFNSDAILPPNWPLELDKFYKRFGNMGIPVPYETLDKRFAWQEQDIKVPIKYELIEGGIRGTCIILTRKQVEYIYPIPDGIKVWFGDNWIYEILRKIECVTWMLYNITVYHALSQNIINVPEAIHQIEEDKEWWKLFGEEDKKVIINKYWEQWER
jgi:hypothetical protein